MKIDKNTPAGKVALNKLLITIHHHDYLLNTMWRFEKRGIITKAEHKKYLKNATAFLRDYFIEATKTLKAGTKNV